MSKSTAILDREQARKIHEHNGDGRYANSWGYRALHEYAQLCLHYLDCAPEGARFLTAVGQDFNGVPLGPADYVSTFGGPGPALRRVYTRKGRDWQAEFAERGSLTARKS